MADELKADQKRAWVTKHFGPAVPVICCKSRDKALHMTKPGNYLNHHG